MPGPLSTSENIADFPQAWGNRQIALVDHKGPASYASIVTGSPPTGGDVLTAAECGLKFISAVYAGISDDGTYNVEATPTVGAQGEVTQVRLIWITANTGAQVSAATNLSARSIRCLVIGR
jgi:hypothetical protein